MKIIKIVFVCGLISFIAVLGSRLYDHWFYENEIGGSGFMSIVILAIWWIPGALILSIFKGGWAVIHNEKLFNLVPVISFVFWFIVLLGIRKGVLFLKKYFRKDRAGSTAL